MRKNFLLKLTAVLLVILGYNVDVNAASTVYSVTGGGSYCSGGTGVSVGLTGSDAGVNYQLYNGSTAVGAVVVGTGAPISFPLQTASGNYTVIGDPATVNSTNMTGSATVVVNPLPTAYTVTGGGGYCAGGAGSPVGLTFGSSGVQYTLYNGASAIATVGGSNSTLSFGNMTTAGTYTAVATITSTGCTRNMNGSAVVSINSVPTAYNMTGNGSFCSGGAGIVVGLANSTAGVSYQLYNGSSVVGSPIVSTGGAFNFGAQTTTGIYSVIATTSAGCTANMTGISTVIQNATPPVFTVGGGGSYCSGGSGLSVTLNGSTAGVNYQLYNGASTVGAAVAGTGSSITFGTFTAAGTYSVLATNATTGCTAVMSNTAVIVINTPPTAFTVGGTGNFCTGGTGLSVTLSSSQSNVNYQLYRSGSPVGSPIPGTTGLLDFGFQTEAGIYTILATSTLTGCTSTMSGSATITVNPLPIIRPVTGGGNYCAGSTGVAVGLGGSQTGVNYTLYNGATPIGSAVAGTNSPISFGVQTMSGTYTVFALNPTTGCSNLMSGSASIGINPLPTVYPVSGTGSYCAGGAGLPVGLSNSATGVNYALSMGSTLVSVMSGTGSALNFGNMTTAGTYTVQATNSVTGCTSNMNGSAVIAVNALPSQFTVSSSGTSYCAGGAGITIGLTGTTTSGVDYQLYNGAATVGAPVAGGGTVSFGAKTAAGTYSVLATNTTTGCTRAMIGTASVTINSLPTVFAMSGGGSYCAGGTGVGVSLAGSESGVSYQLYNGAATTGSAVGGSGSAISFGPQTAAGTYSVLATNTSTSCARAMSGSSIVVMNPVPVAQTVGGGGSYCAGGTGVAVNIASSVSGINYQLYNGLTAVGTPQPGTGALLSFGLQTAAGTYMVKATNSITGCTSDMTGSVSVNISPLPATYTVTGGGSYCVGSTGVAVGLSGSTSGVSYQLLDGAMPVGSPVTGGGAAINFGTFTNPATYNVSASNGTCTVTMTGSATIVANAVPVAQTVTGGGNYCSGGTGVHIGLTTTQAGVSYQLRRNGVPTGSLAAGSGLALDFGLVTAAGDYTVMGYNSATGCTNAMSNMVTVAVDMLPVVHTVTGGGSYCAGGSGVSIGLGSSSAGVSYQLYNGSALAGTAVFGTALPVDMGTYTIPGTYSVQATDLTTGCMSDMSGTATISINPLPQLHTVAGGGTICQNSAGVAVTLNGSNTGVNYQLYLGSATVGAPVPGTGSNISFGLQTAAGTYTVMAVNATTMCSLDMAGSVNVLVNPLPTAQTLTGGGSYCAEGPGLMLSLLSSNANTTYQLYNGSTAVGGPVAGVSGFPISFGLQTAAGNYTVNATSTITGCQRAMSGTATISINPLPLAQTVTGGGAYCTGGAGVSIGLGSSVTGVSYQLYNGPDPVGTAMAGDGTPIDFGMQTEAGLYKVYATNDITSCGRYMNGSATVVVNDLPLEYPVTGGGSYCAGGAGIEVGLQMSTIGVAYQLYRGGVLMGAPVAGNGGEISFGMQTAQGTYSVLATNSTTGCTKAMVGSTDVLINALPEAYAVSGGGALCAGAAGVNIMIEGSEGGMEYQLYNGTTAMGAFIEGAGDPISFGAQTMAGTYTVRAMNPATGCVLLMTGSVPVIVNALPLAKNMTGGGAYCAGGTGVAVGLAASQTGVSYQLYVGGTATGPAVEGNNSSITFGMQTAEGTYSVLATNDVTGCTNAMNTMVSVTVNALPVAQPVLSIGSSYCAGGEGVNILLNSSESTATYQLYNGPTPMGAAMPGTNGIIDFGAQTVPGTYHVIGTNILTGCSNLMTGSPSVIINPLPTAFPLTGGGAYCEGAAGSVINQSGSQLGVTYQLYNTAGPVGSPVAGNAGPLSFGAQPAGSYVVIATNNISECTRQMTNTVVSVFNEAPMVKNVLGGGAYCAGGTGVEVMLDGSQVGVSYKLYRGGVLMSTMAGDGGEMTFGPQTISGTYSVLATNVTTGCTKAMSGSKVVTMNAVPAAYGVTGGGAYCSGSGGMAVGLANSALPTANISYQLYRGSLPVLGAVVNGANGPITFGNQTVSGAYAVVATNTVTGCTSNMIGSVTVTENAIPEAFTLTGGGSYCDGPSATGVPVGVSSSVVGISYQLYKDGVATGGPVAGTGDAISFGMQMAAGEYTVRGRNTTTLCTNWMTGSVNVSVNASVVPAIEMSSALGTTVCLGSLVTFNSSSVNGGTAPVYQWKVNGMNTGLGLTSHSYVPVDGDVVSVTMTSSAVCATPASVTAEVTMHVSAHLMPQVMVSAMPNDTVCQGTTVTYTATDVAGGTAPFFIWKKNGVTVGAGPVYSYVPANGDVITVEMTSNFPCRLQDVVSTDTKMRVVVPTTPEVTITANPGLTISEGQNLKLTAHVANGGSNVAYRWSVNGTEIAGATNAMYMSSDLQNNDEVTVMVTSGGYCAGLTGSETVVVKVSALGVGTASLANTDVRLLPNPNSGNFIVRGTVGTDDKEVSIDVTDVLGQVVYRGAVKVNNGAIDSRIELDKTLANGMYLLTIRTATESKAFHFVMQQ